MLEIISNVVTGFNDPTVSAILIRETPNDRAAEINSIRNDKSAREASCAPTVTYSNSDEAMSVNSHKVDMIQSWLLFIVLIKI